ncbi:carbohydrate kinase [Rhodobacterales bacterium]|nr:carbohydrate kinase [Rhodobacterales bacterium]
MVTAIGAIHHDTIAHALETVMPETSTPSTLELRPGGVATNVARSLGRLGIKTGLIGTVGDDGTASALLQKLEHEGIETSTIARPGFTTGQYIAFHDPNGTLAAACVDDRVLSYAPADLFDQLIEARRRAIPDGSIWFLDANLPEPVLARVLDAIGNEVIVANAVSDAKANRLTPHLTRLDCLMLNRGEAVAITKLGPQTSTDDLASALQETGLARFVLTAGAGDVLVLDEGKTTRVPVLPAHIVDVTGAGDALTAGTLAAMAHGMSFRDAVPFGLRAAALTLQSTGALADALSWQALEDF